MRSPYGVYRTRTYANIWSTADSFLDDWKACGLYESGLLTDDEIKKIYYLLYASYGNSHIMSSDENRFKYALYAKIYSFGPAWAKRIDIQAKLRALSEDDIRLGTKAVYNRALNPETEPTTDTLEEISYINEQNTQKYQKSALEGYALLWELIDTDVTTEFIGQFASLFIQFQLPEGPLYYATGEEEEE